MIPDPFSSAATTTVTGSAPSGSGQFGRFDLYALLVNDTGRISDRRQTMNNIFLTVNSVLFGSLAVLAQQSGLRSVFFVFVEVFLSIAGIYIARQWLALSNKYQNLVKLRYETLMQIEQLPDFPGETKMYTIENEHPETWGFSNIERHLPVAFMVMYVAGSVFLVLGTYAVKSGLVDLIVNNVSLPHF